MYRMYIYILVHRDEETSIWRRGSIYYFVATIEHRLLLVAVAWNLVRDLAQNQTLSTAGFFSQFFFFFFFF